MKLLLSYGVNILRWRLSLEQTILQSLFTLGRRCRLARSYGPCWLERYIEADEADYRFDSLNVVSNAAWPSVFSLVVLS